MQRPTDDPMLVVGLAPDDPRRTPVEGATETMCGKCGRVIVLSPRIIAMVRSDDWIRCPECAKETPPKVIYRKQEDAETVEQIFGKAFGKPDADDH